MEKLRVFPRPLSDVVADDFFLRQKLLLLQQPELLLHSTKPFFLPLDLVGVVAATTKQRENKLLLLRSPS